MNAGDIATATRAEPYPGIVRKVAVVDRMDAIGSRREIFEDRVSGGIGELRQPSSRRFHRDQNAGFWRKAGVGRFHRDPAGCMRFGRRGVGVSSPVSGGFRMKSYGLGRVDEEHKSI